MEVGERYRLPNGCPVQVRNPVHVPAAAWELEAPGGWARWAIDQAGRIMRVEPSRRGYVLRDTTGGWTSDDLIEG